MMTLTEFIENCVQDDIELFKYNRIIYLRSSFGWAEDKTETLAFDSMYDLIMYYRDSHAFDDLMFTTKKILGPEKFNEADELSDFLPMLKDVLHKEGSVNKQSKLYAEIENCIEMIKVFVNPESIFDDLDELSEFKSVCHLLSFFMDLSNFYKDIADEYINKDCEIIGVRETLQYLIEKGYDKHKICDILHFDEKDYNSVLDNHNFNNISQ